MHRIYFPQLAESRPGAIAISGEEAHHAARVKRLETGEQVELFDGLGLVTRALVSGIERHGKSDTTLTLDAEPARHVPPVRPRISVYTPAPKGDALEWMIDQLSQVGASAWGLLRTEHSEREPRRMDRLLRTTIESAKQCGRAHLLELLPPRSLEEALHLPGHIVAADAAGQPQSTSSTDEVVVLIGPEGGFSPRELELMQLAGIATVRFGPHVMRIETAAVVAASGMLEQNTNRGA